MIIYARSNTDGAHMQVQTRLFVCLVQYCSALSKYAICLVMFSDQLGYILQPWNRIMNSPAFTHIMWVCPKLVESRVRLPIKQHMITAETNPAEGLSLGTSIC